MKFNTSYFGEINVPDDRVINFELGIPAFPDENSFVLIHDEEHPESIFLWLQSTKTPELVFTIIDTLAVLPNYAPSVPEEELQGIKENDDDDFFIYNIANISDSNKIEDITVNLKGPIIINQKTGRGRQVISDDAKHDIRYAIFNDIQNRKKA